MNISRCAFRKIFKSGQDIGKCKVICLAINGSSDSVGLMENISTGGVLFNRNAGVASPTLGDCQFTGVVAVGEAEVLVGLLLIAIGICKPVRKSLDKRFFI